MTGLLNFFIFPVYKLLASVLKDRGANFEPEG